MNITHYFIKHPVIAIVFNTMIAVIGLLCLYQLPLREYPNIIVPAITVTAYYPNASAELVESAVTNILEERLAGLEGLDTITSESHTDNAQISLKFNAGTSMDKALNAVQDAISGAKSLLPIEVKSPLVERQNKATGLPFIGIALESTNKDFGKLTHYANLNLKNIFRNIPGVSAVEVWGQPYTYRIQLAPDKLFSFGVNVDEVIRAIVQSHISLPAGKYQNKIPSTLHANPKTAEDYENILVKPHLHHPIFLKSIASVALGTDNEQFRIRVNGHAGLVLSISRC